MTLPPVDSEATHRIDSQTDTLTVRTTNGSLVLDVNGEAITFGSYRDVTKMRALAVILDRWVADWQA